MAGWRDKWRNFEQGQAGVSSRVNRDVARKGRESE
jgi:hypothetical protein